MAYKDKVAQSSYQSDWVKARRNRWLAENGPCRACHCWDRLEVDHVDPSQKVSHAVWSWAEPRRLAELAKCQPLCRVCHAKKTAQHNRIKNKGRPGRPEKLTESDVLKIRSFLREGKARRAIAAIFGVNQSTITGIASGRIWSWLKAEVCQLDLIPREASKAS